MPKNNKSEFYIWEFYKKIITRNFTYGIMLRSANSEFRVIVLCTILKNINSNFSESAKTFNVKTERLKGHVISKYHVKPFTQITANYKYIFF